MVTCPLIANTIPQQNIDKKLWESHELRGSSGAVKLAAWALASCLHVGPGISLTGFSPARRCPSCELDVEEVS